jgi:hypothetical protein
VLQKSLDRTQINLKYRILKKNIMVSLTGFLLINLQAQKPKVIIDAYTWNEIDDIPAIVNGLKSDKMDVLHLVTNVV